MSVRTLPGGALVVWPETLSRTPWLINKSAGGPPYLTGVRAVYSRLPGIVSQPAARQRRCGPGIGPSLFAVRNRRARCSQVAASYLVTLILAWVLRNTRGEQLAVLKRNRKFLLPGKYPALNFRRALQLSSHYAPSKLILVDHM